MAEHCGYIVKITELNKHPNADKLQIATIFGASVIVDLNVKIDDIGVYFPIDLQLSEEYCNQNNLVRKLDENGKNIGGYLEPNKRNIRAMRFRGSKSEGLYMPLQSLQYTGKIDFSVGDKIDTINNHLICQKYIPNTTNKTSAAADKKNHRSKKKIPISPLFLEHVETEQLAYNLDAFNAGDYFEITLKMHGTSGRTGYLPRLVGFKRTLLDFILKREGTPIYDWGYVSGTRRVVLKDFNNGFYGDNSFREPHAKIFEGKLHKGETAYYEIVGFTNNGTPIMPEANNEKLQDKDFLKRYGKTTVFSYGCSPTGEILRHGRDEQGRFAISQKVPISDIYVYRMTLTNEDGIVVEYPPDLMRYRCEQMGVKTVPVLWKDRIPKNVWIDTHSAGEWMRNVAEDYCDGPDPIGKTHIREGVVIRIVNRPDFCAYKYKNFNFKVLSGIAASLAAESGAIDTMDEDRIAEL